MFKTDMGDYPISDSLSGGAPEYAVGGTAVTTGAQHLAEALLGRDLRGFDPQSTWDAAEDYTNVATTGTYSTDSTGSPSPQQQSLDRRKGPYLDVENVGAFNINQLYPNTYGPSGIYGFTDPANAAGPGTLQAPFITDVYTDRTVTITYQTTGGDVSKNVRAGSPVLYFKANPTNKNLKRDTGGNATFTDRTYNYYDNENLLGLGKMGASTPTPHPMYLDNKKFYEAITNYQIPDVEGVAYRADSFILMSAGKNGLFGDADDIYNFGD
jgi:hypothetical protein